TRATRSATAAIPKQEARMQQEYSRRRFIGHATAAGALAWTWTSRQGALAQAKDEFLYAETEGFQWSVPYVASGTDTWAKAGLAPKTAVFSSGRLGTEAMLAK